MNRPAAGGLLHRARVIESRYHPGLVAILVLGGFLRLWSLASYPKWYSDEANHLRTVQSLREGWPLACGVYRHTEFTPFFPYTVLFHLQCAPLLRLVHPDILAVRIPAALASVAAIWLIYLIAHELAGLLAGLTAATAAAVHPLSVLWDRWGYPQAFGMLFAAGAFYALLRYRRRPAWGWAAAAGLSAGFAVAYSYWMLPLAAFVALYIVLLRRLRNWLHAMLACAAGATLLGLLAAPFAAKFGLDALASDFVKVVGVNREFVGGPQSRLPLQLLTTLENYAAFARIDLFMALGMIGLFCAKERWQKLSLIAVFVLLSGYVIRVRGDHIHNFFYNAYPFRAFLFVGFGLLVARLVAITGKWIRERDYGLRLTYSALGLCAAGALFGRAAVADAVAVAHRAPTAIDELCVQDRGDALRLADWANARMSGDAGRFVIASSGIQWLLRGRATDLLAVSAREGRRAFIFAPDMPPARYAFDCSLGNAKYFVADSLFRRWTVHQGCAWLVTRMEHEKWPLVFRLGEYSVYANPKCPGDPVVEAQPLILSDPGLYRQSAQEAMERGAYAEAVEEYRKLLRMTPNDANSLSNAGTAYARLRNLRLASVYLKRALMIDPQHEAARRSLDAVERELGEQPDRTDRLPESLAPPQPPQPPRPPLPGPADAPQQRWKP